MHTSSPGEWGTKEQGHGSYDVHQAIACNQRHSMQDIYARFRHDVHRNTCCSRLVSLAILASSSDTQSWSRLHRGIRSPKSRTVWQYSHWATEDCIQIYSSGLRSCVMLLRSAMPHSPAVFTQANPPTAQHRNTHSPYNRSTLQDVTRPAMPIFRDTLTAVPCKIIVYATDDVGVCGICGRLEG